MSKPPRPRLTTHTWRGPLSWCGGCEVHAVGPDALATMKAHLLASPSCSTIYAVQVTVLSRREPDDSAPPES